MNSGASLANGASHCTRRNSSTPRWRPVARRSSANGSAERPTTADAKEQPVRARHVGDGVRSEAGVGAGLPREHDVYGVFRQRGEQRNHDQRERAGDIALRGFRTPRHREGRADDTEAEDQCADLGRSRQETGSKQHGGKARDDDEPEGDDAARRGMPDGGDPHVCAPHGAVSASLVGALKKDTRPAPHRSAVWYGPEVWLGRLRCSPVRPRRIAEYVDLTFAPFPGGSYSPPGRCTYQITRSSRYRPPKAS